MYIYYHMDIPAMTLVPMFADVRLHRCRCAMTSVPTSADVGFSVREGNSFYRIGTDVRARPGSRLRWYDSGCRQSLIYALPPCTRPGLRHRPHANNDIGTDIGRCKYTTTWTSQP